MAQRDQLHMRLGAQGEGEPQRRSVHHRRLRATHERLRPDPSRRPSRSRRRRSSHDRRRRRGRKLVGERVVGLRVVRRREGDAAVRRPEGDHAGEGRVVVAWQLRAVGQMEEPASVGRNPAVARRRARDRPGAAAVADALRHAEPLRLVDRAVGEQPRGVGRVAGAVEHDVGGGAARLGGDPPRREVGVEVAQARHDLGPAAAREAQHDRVRVAAADGRARRRAARERPQLRRAGEAAGEAPVAVEVEGFERERRDRSASRRCRNRAAAGRTARPRRPSRPARRCGRSRSSPAARSCAGASERTGPRRRSRRRQPVSRSRTAASASAPSRRPHGRARRRPASPSCRPNADGNRPAPAAARGRRRTSSRRRCDRRPRSSDGTSRAGRAAARRSRRRHRP